MKAVRLAYLVAHPIIYQAPLLRRLAYEPDIELKVFFGSDDSARTYEAGFGKPVAWDVSLLNGYNYEVLPALNRAVPVSFFRPLNYDLSSRLRKGNFDALWIHGYMRWNHWLAIADAHRFGIKVFIRDEATDISRARGLLRRTAKQKFFKYLNKFVAGFLAIGRLNREYYIRQGVPANKVFCVPYAVDNSFFQKLIQIARKESASAMLRRALDLESNRPVILYLGKLLPHKRPDDLLAAYAGLSPDGRREPYPYLIYVGDGELGVQLMNDAAKTRWRSIRFVGFKNQTEIPTFYELCDVFVMPSIFEPWGLVVNEAMNAGKAVIVSDRVGCRPDLVRDGVNGFIFKAGDAKDLTRALRAALSDPRRCVEMGCRSLEIINGWSFEEDVQGLRAALRI